MIAQLDVLTKKLRSVEAEIEVELAKHAEELRFRIENRKIVFEQHVKRIHRAIKVRASRYFIEANPLIVLSAPVIYSLIVPVMLVDIWVMAYQAICFPVYRIPKVRRRDCLVRPPPSGLSQRHREDQLRLLLLLQRRDRLCPRGGVAHRSLLVPDQACPPGARRAPALPWICRLRRR